MGVFQSTVHFDHLNGIIDNQTSYQIQYNVIGPIKPEQEEKLSYKEIKEADLFQDTDKFQYAGVVTPYCTKYFQFKEIEDEYRFSVYAMKLNQAEEKVIIPLEQNLKIESQKTVCLRITPELKVIHMAEHEIKELQNRKAIQTEFQEHSKIVTNVELSHRLSMMLPNTLKSPKMLYRASEHNFDMKKFFVNFGNVQNVLLICKTNAQKIIGGYSKGAFAYLLEDGYDQKGWRSLSDVSNSSFIFSLSSNDKFILKPSQTALFYNKDKQQICFGSDELRINNHSDKNSCLTQNLNTNYENHNYNNDSDSYLLLNGNEGPQFTTKEWQVWGFVREDDQDSSQQQEIINEMLLGI